MFGLVVVRLISQIGTWEVGLTEVDRAMSTWTDLQFNNFLLR